MSVKELLAVARLSGIAIGQFRELERSTGTHTYCDSQPCLLLLYKLGTCNVVVQLRWFVQVCAC